MATSSSRVSHCKVITDWCRKKREPPYLLARRAGVSVSALYRLINGVTRQPGIDVLEKLAYAMDHTPVIALIESLRQPPEN